MAKAKKRTKQVKDMIAVANEILRNNHVIEESNEMFWTVSMMLLKTGLYQGFNRYYEKEYINNEGKKATIILTASYEEAKEKNGFLQFY